jgi:signal transduction histidine kinase
VPGKKYSREAIIAASTGLRSLLPYALIPAVIVLLFFTWRKGVDVSLARGVYFGEIALVGLVLLRQFFTIRETIYYNKELRQVQQELHSKNQALSEANKQLEEQAAQIAAAYEQEHHLNELKDQFLLNVNHELRTPLTAVHGYLELLQEYQGQLDATREANFINLAVQGCEELQQLVSNVLDTIQGDSQGKAPQIEVLPFAEVVQEVINLFEPQRQQEYHIEVNIPETLAVMADRQYLHQVLMNLLSNAFKYSPKDTVVVVSAQLPDFPAGEGYKVCI